MILVLIPRDEAATAIDTEPMRQSAVAEGSGTAEPAPPAGFQADLAPQFEEMTLMSKMLTIPSPFASPAGPAAPIRRNEVDVEDIYNAVEVDVA